jgi:tetratricopeptide (TPR) repeat protein
VGLGLLVATTVAFWPTLWNGFVWDDDLNFSQNPHYRGLGWPQLRWMLTTTHSGHYIPVTWLTFAVDYLLWGLNPFGYHLGNLLVHGLAVLLFFAVARELLERSTTLAGDALVLGTGGAALFFAIHPLRVESVAWVTERRDLLSGALFLGTVLTYLRAVDAVGTRRRTLLAVSIACHALALGAKSIVMTAPLVLLLLDVYPLRRLGHPRQWLRPAVRRGWLEKLPYFGLSLAAGLVATYAQFHSTTLRPYPWPARIGIAVYTLWFYLRKTILPVALSPLYEVPVPLDPFALPFVGSAIGLAGVTGLLVLLRRRWPAGLALWAYYGLVLFPLTGLVVRAGFQLAADRYSYLSCLPWALLVGAALGVGWRAWRQGRLAPGRAALAWVAVVVWFLGLGALTWRLGPVWHDTGTLWRRAVAVTPDCAICQNNLGAYLLATGRPGEAVPHLRAAVAIRPERLNSRTSLGRALAQLGLWPEAIGEFEAVVGAEPADSEARNNLGVALIQAGRPRDALPHLEHGLALRPDDAAIRTNLGLALARLGRHDAAAEHFRRAVELRPAVGLARLGLVHAYLALGRLEQAREEHRALQAVDPRLARAAESALAASGAATARP